MNTRLLGTLCLIGGAAYIILAVYDLMARINDTSRDPFSIVLGIVWMIGAICGWIGYFQLRGTGENIAIRFLSLIPVVGLTLALVLAIYSTLFGLDPFDNPLFGIALLVELIGIVLNAIFAIASRALPGWRRFAPMMVLAGFIGGGLIAALLQGAVLGIPFGLGVGYSALGYAVLSLSVIRQIEPIAV